MLQSVLIQIIISFNQCFMNKQRLLIATLVLILLIGAGILAAKQFIGDQAPPGGVDHNRDPFANIKAPDGLDPLVAARYEGEIAGTKKLYEEKPDIWETWIGIGNLKNLLEDYDGAIAAYQKSLEITPNNILGYRNLAEVYRQGLKDNQTAATYYQLAIKQNFADIELYLELAQIYHKQLNQPDKALAVYEDARTRWPTKPDILTTLINFYKDTGNKDKYAETVQLLRQTYPDNELYRVSYRDVPLK